MSLVSFVEDWLQDIDYSDQQLPETMNPPQTPASAHKRRRGISSSTTSQGVPTPSAFSSEPSYSKGIRRKLVGLFYTTPAVIFGPPEYYTSLGLEIQGDNEEVIPEEICKLVKRFSEYSATPLFDVAAKEQIKTLAPLEIFTQEAINGHTSAHVYTSSKLAEYLPYVSKVFSDARRYYLDMSDEATWSKIVRLLLEDNIGPKSTLRIAEAQTRWLHPELLPNHHGPVASSRVDFAVEFNPDHSDIVSLLRPVFQTQQPNFSLSAFNEVAAAHTFTAAIVEVKPPAGVFAEAIYQVAITSAAVLQRLKILDGAEYIVGDGLPVISWIVYGHSWYLNYAYYCKNGSIMMLGPYTAGNTSTVLGIFQIMHIVREVKAWAKDEYWGKLVRKLEKFKNTS